MTLVVALIPCCETDTVNFKRLGRIVVDLASNIHLSVSEQPRNQQSHRDSPKKASERVEFSEPRRPRVLFVFPFEATFIQRDLELLQSFCEVKPFLFAGSNGYAELVRHVQRVDVVFSWFALPFAAAASLVARLTGRISILVSGGWDVAREREIGYGRPLTFRNALVARTALSTAHAVLAFSDSSLASIRQLAPHAPVQRAYLGVDSKSFFPVEKEAIVVSIANLSRENIVRKGLVAFVHAARELPRNRFVIVGRHVDDAVEILRAIAPSNVSFPGWLAESDLRSLLGRAQVYVQASYTEGFGVALAEAMASGCVPVVTRRGALPEVVGETGFYVPYGDSTALAEATRSALNSDLGPRARDRIAERFTLEERLNTLRSLIYELTRRPDATRNLLVDGE